MSSTAIVRTLLAAAAGVTASVPVARIYLGVIPQGAAVPAIGIEKVSAVERLTVSMAESSRFRSDRVQVTVYAATYQAKDTILEAVRTALVGQRGTVATFDLDSILPDIEGPDFDDEAATIFERSRDFFVRWRT